MKTIAAQLLACFCSLLLLIGLTGCAADGLSVNTSGSGASAKSKSEQKLDENVFPKDKVIDVNITMDEADFQDMLDNAINEEFKPAYVEYNGVKYDNIAIRTKGNSSLRSIVGMADSDRYSFKLSFDEYVTQTIEGISKINLNNNYSDATSMREFLSYEIAEEMGLPTPKHSFVSIYFNGELWGLYLAVEQIGTAYLERNFGNAYGSLYKANGGNGSELNWLETADAYTGLDAKSDKADSKLLLDMLNELNNGTDYDSVLDVEEALKFIALNAVAGNMDSYLGNFKHNYYLYENKGVFSVLPWDFNMAFGGFGRSSNLLIDEPTAGKVADRPLVDKLLQSDAYKEQYHAIIADMLQGYLADETFQSNVAAVQALISPYVKADPTAFYTYEQYEQGITELISFNRTQMATIAKQLDGTEPSSGDGSGSGGSMGGGFGGGMGEFAPPGRQGGFPAGGFPAGGGNDTAAMPAMGNAVPNGQGGGADGELAPPGGGQEGGAFGGGMQPDGQVDGPFGGGMGEMGDMGGMAPPGGGQGWGGMAPPDGQGWGGPNGQAAVATTDRTQEAITAGVALVLLLLSCVLVVFYKRKRL